MKEQSSKLIGIILLLGFNFSALSAGESTATVKSENVEAKVTQAGKALKTLFLDQATRLKIDQQREAFLKPIAVKNTEKILAKELAGSKKPKVKRIYIPPKVTVSAVIEMPDGSRLVRVNNKYNRSPSRHIDMNFSHSSTDGVPVTVQGKTKIVPVGSTLLTRKNKLVKTYKLEQAARKKVVPKTKQVAVKERLEQVQILTPK
ncbi:MAG: hypothetical protein ISEC1_P2004 [Thiomicrorhabdus sp.]|nr:MAG: hypothetical protein ISEC1_P2004 [Thiomicrorhabdus sp.]